MPVHYGYEVQIDNDRKSNEDDYHITGTLYSLTKPLANPQARPEWNTMVITLDGPAHHRLLNDSRSPTTPKASPSPIANRFEPQHAPRPNEATRPQNHSENTSLLQEVSVSPEIIPKQGQQLFFKESVCTFN